MPRRPTARKDRWLLDNNGFGYVQDRNGIAVVRYADKEKTLGIRFTPQNRALGKRLADPIVTEWRRQERLGEGASRGMTPDNPAGLGGYTIGGMVRKFLALNIKPTDSKTKRATYKIVVSLLNHGLTVCDAVAMAESERIAAHLERGGYADRTRKIYLGYLRKFWRYCISYGIIQRDPFTTVPIPRIKQSRDDVRPYTTGEIARLLRYCHRRAQEPAAYRGAQPGETRRQWYELGLLIRLVWRTGMRRGEALALTAADLTENGIRISKSLTGGVTGPTKTGDTRIFPIALEPALPRLLRSILDLGHTGSVWRWKSDRAPHDLLDEALLGVGLRQRAEPEEGKAKGRITEGEDIAPFHAMRDSRNEIWKVRGLPRALRAELFGHDEKTNETSYTSVLSATDMERMVAAYLPRNGGGVPPQRRAELTED